MLDVSQASIDRATRNKLFKDMIGPLSKSHYKRRYIGRPYSIKCGLQRIKNSK